jgi:hypothetical protein
MTRPDETPGPPDRRLFYRQADGERQHMDLRSEDLADAVRGLRKEGLEVYRVQPLPLRRRRAAAG